MAETMTERPALPLLVIDGDCAFCQASAARAQRMIRRMPNVKAWQQLVAAGHLAAPGGVGSLDGRLSVDECTRAVQYVALDGRVHTGHDAVSALLMAAGGGWWPLGALLRVPGIRQGAAVAYRWVARHRHQLPGGSDRCSLSSAASSSSAR